MKNTGSCSLRREKSCFRGDTKPFAGFQPANRISADFFSAVPDKGRWEPGKGEKLFFTRKSRTSAPKFSPLPEPLSSFQKKRGILGSKVSTLLVIIYPYREQSQIFIRNICNGIKLSFYFLLWLKKSIFWGILPGRCNDQKFKLVFVTSAKVQKTPFFGSCLSGNHLKMSWLVLGAILLESCVILWTVASRRKVTVYFR